jgi:glycosyltransferase involved in cell wall biosynthesis
LPHHSGGPPLRLALVHGYYLHDSGSGVFIRELASELVRQGHDITLVCQERMPDRCDFIDQVYGLEAGGRRLVRLYSREPVYKGRCRLVRPTLKRLLVYVDGPFPGFDSDCVAAFQDSPDDWLEGYVSGNLAALRAAFAAWPPQAVLANHAMMQPHIVNRALAGAAPYIATVHGSELNFSVKNDPRLVPYTLDGLGAAAAVVTVSDASAQDVTAWASGEGLEIGAKTHTVTPGVNTRTFAPAPDREGAIAALRRDVPLPDNLRLHTDHRILAYAGRLMWTKGVQHAIAALPFIVARQPSVSLLVAGEGPGREPLERLAQALGEGDQEAARSLAANEAELQTLPRFGPVVSQPVPQVGKLPVFFLGHLSSTQLGRLFAAADISLAPSVFPEAVGLVTTEALSAGALPIASYHSGLASVVDVVADSLGDPNLKSLTPGLPLTDELARLASRALERYPMTEPRFRFRLHDLCRERFPSWEKVAKRYLELARTGCGGPRRTG